MARDTSDSTPIEGKSSLIYALERGGKPQDQWRIGTEHEKFGFYRESLAPVPYEGEAGIEAILRGMEKLLGWEAIMDGEAIIGLASPAGGAISLEPGGQFELSGAPLQTIHETCRETSAHLAQLRQIAEPMGIGFLGVGASPKWSRAITPMMPKSRYKIMANYMPQVGTLGLDMMFRTTTIQVNLDFADEADMRRKMQVATALQPLATILFANSPLLEGAPNGYLSYRGHVWQNTDNNRTGIHPFIFEPSFGFEHYVDWALDVPMYFVRRDGTYYDCTDVTFRQFMDGGLKDRVPDPVPNLGDWDNHISTLFPEARLKRFIEMRGADGGPWRDICALPAFWVGLMYDDTALNAAADLVAGWTQDDRLTFLRNAPKQGLKGHVAGRPVLEIAREAVEISRRGLNARRCVNDMGVDEQTFLAPLEETVTLGVTPAERMLKRFHGRWNGDVSNIFVEYAY